MRWLTVLAALATVCFAATSAQATHPRPKGAAWDRWSLVPAYAPCAAPNRAHGPPLSFPSCGPPAQTSPHLTVGTADANGAAANFIGDFSMIAYIGVPGPPDDSDLGVKINLEDVRCVPPLATCGNANTAGGFDYTGGLSFAVRIRITDHWNAIAPGGGTDPATMEDREIQASGFSSPCSQTASVATGSVCALWTSWNAFIPGSIKDGKRAGIELDNVRVYDGGADGDASTTADNTVFARPGVFIP